MKNKLKVHFAGCESIIHSKMLKEICGVNYALMSVYKFIIHKYGIKPVYKESNISNKDFIKYVNGFKHIIMDSGLFTLMFGKTNLKNINEKILNSWLNDYINFVNENKFTGTIVEVDAQKLIGAEKTWKLRKIIKDNIKNDIINVLHIEDGFKGIDKLIEYSNYIALSVPEMRINFKNEFKKKLINIAGYIKNKKPDIKIHLLGCTDGRYGVLKMNKSKIHKSQININSNKFIEYKKEMNRIFKEINVKPPKTLIEYYIYNY